MVKKVDRIIDEVGAGTTLPLLGEIEDDIVIIKTFGNPWGNKVLANEFISLELAKILELPIPNGGLCVVDSKTEMQDLMMLEIDPESIKGIGFYSIKVDKAIEIIDIDEDLLELISNIDDIFKTIVFDHLIYNIDRHEGNMLLDIVGKGKIYIIDHSHVFNLGYDWNKNKLNNLIEKEDFKDIKIMKSNIDLYNLFINKIDKITYTRIINDFKNIIKNRVNIDILKDIISKVPEEWVNKEDKEGILEYLMYRLNNIDYICDYIINNLNNPGGEVYENIVFDIEL